MSREASLMLPTSEQLPSEPGADLCNVAEDLGPLVVTMAVCPDGKTPCAAPNYCKVTATCYNSKVEQNEQG